MTYVYSMGCSMLIPRYRLRPKRIVNPSSLLRGDTGTSYGFIRLYMRTILVLWFRLPLRNKLSVDLIQILWNHGELLWNGC